MDNSIKTMIKDRETSQLFIKYSNKTFELFKKRCMTYAKTENKNSELVNVLQKMEKGNLLNITFRFKYNNSTFEISYFYDNTGKLTSKGFTNVGIDGIIPLERFREANKLCNELVKL